MRWSVVANGRVTAILQQLLLWWLLSLVTLSPWGGDSEDSHPSERGQILSCCLCGTAPAILSSTPSARQPRPPGFSLGLQQVALEGLRGLEASSFPGVSLPEILYKGIFFFFFFQHSLFLASCPCVTLSVVPNMSPYCSWFVSHVPNTITHCVLSQS